MTTNEETIKRYFDAWEKQNAYDLPNIFTEDAVVSIYPFGVEEYKGLLAIEEYWNSVVMAQMEPKPVVLHKLVGYHRVFVEWECQFGTKAQERKHMRGVMVLEFRGGLICELREYYVSQTASA